MGSLLAYDVLTAGGADEDDHLLPPPSPGVYTFTPALPRAAGGETRPAAGADDYGQWPRVQPTGGRGQWSAHRPQADRR